MSRPVNANPHRHQRRKRLVDYRLQGILLVAMLLLELSLLVGAMLYLYWRFDEIIQANLYIIHKTARVDLQGALAIELGKVLLVAGIANTFALLVGHQLWSNHVRHVTRTFGQRANHIATLDLGTPPPYSGPRHEVIDQLEGWRRNEARRMAAIELQIQQMEQAHRQPGQLRQLIADCRGLLPN